MSNPRKYICTGCGEVKERNDLVTRRVQFREMGPKGRVLMSRVTGWLCDTCLHSDPAYTQESHDTPTERATVV